MSAASAMIAKTETKAKISEDKDTTNTLDELTKILLLKWWQGIKLLRSAGTYHS